MAILVTGGTGFVGQQFIDSVKSSKAPINGAITAVSRNRDRAKAQLGDSVDDVLQWDPSMESIAFPPGTHYDHVVNLMGESIAEGRWTKAKKKRIYDSRVTGSRNLVDGLLKTGNLPNVFVSASAIGIYGDPGESLVDENYQLTSDFAASLCQDWEQEAMRLAQHGTRVVCLRIGIVIGGQGGAIERLLPIFRWGLGGKLGSGRQWMSWIHVDDLVAMIHWALTTDSVSGPVNATAPNPVRNATFTQALATAVKRPALLPAPKFALRCVFGEFANSLFYSQRVIPQKATDLGFQFQHPHIADAIVDVISGQG